MQESKRLPMVVREVAEFLNRSLPPEELVQGVLDRILDALGLPMGWGFLQEEGRWIPSATRHTPPWIEEVLGEGLCTCQEKLRTGELTEPVNILNCARLQRLQELRPGDVPTTTHLSIPIRAGEEVLGILNLVLPQGAMPSEEVLATLGAVGWMLGTAVQRARLLEEVQAAAERTQEELEVWQRTVSEIFASLDLEERLRRILSQVARLVRAHFGAVFLVKDRWVQLSVARNLPPWFRSALGEFPVKKAPSWLRQAQELRDPGEMPEVAQKLGAQVWVSLPLRRGRIWVGTLVLGSPRSGDLPPDRVEALKTFIRLLTLAVEHAFLYREAQERLLRLQMLREIDRAINRQLRLDRILGIVLEKTPQAMGADAVAVSLLDPERMRTRVFVMRTPQGSRVEAETFRLAEGLWEWLVQRRKRVVIPDLRRDPRVEMFREHFRNGDFRSYLGVPLVVGDQTLGILHILSRQPARFHEEDIQFFETLAGQAAVAISNAQMLEETQRRAEQQAAAARIGAKALEAQDLSAFLEYTLEQLTRVLGVEKGAIWIREAGLRVLKGVSPEIGEATARTMRSHGFADFPTLAVEDWKNLPQGFPYPFLAPVMERFGIRASLVTPTGVSPKRVGGIALATSRPRPWSGDEVRFLENVARQLENTVWRFELQERLSRQVEVLSRLVDAIPEGVVLLDRERRIVTANPLGREYLELLAGKGEGEVLSHLAGVAVEHFLEPPPPDQPCHELLLPGPPQRVFEVHARSLPDGGLMLTLRDATREREIQAKKALQERLAVVGQLTAGIAHDFNNILTIIIGFGEFLSENPDLPEKSREQARTIVEQGRRAAELIRQILDFSRRTPGGERQPMNLLSFLKEATKLLEKTFPANIRIELTAEEGNYWILGDPTQLQQIITNLAVNARDAMPEGGVLRFFLRTFTLSPEEAPPLPGMRPGAWVELAVSDTGKGIPPEILPRIFEPFFTTKPQGRGTGLGLAQVYGLVQQHEGFIDVKSQVGRGTTFYLYFPAIQHRKRSAPSEASPLQGRGERILLVEDNPEISRTFRVILEGLGYRVAPATSAEEALALLGKEAQPPDLVIVDQDLPGMRGTEFFRKLKERFPEVLGLLITGSLGLIASQDMQLFAGVLLKPMGARELAQAVREALTKGTSAD